MDMGGTSPGNSSSGEGRSALEWRLAAGRQALLVLAYLRCGAAYAQLAVCFGIGIATVYRCIREAIDVTT